MAYSIRVSLVFVIACCTGCVSSELDANRNFWNKVATSNHVKILKFDMSTSDPQMLGYNLVASQISNRPLPRAPIAGFVSPASHATLRKFILQQAAVRLQKATPENFENSGPITKELAAQKLIRTYMCVSSNLTSGPDESVHVSTEDLISFGRAVLREGTGNDDPGKHAFGTFLRLYVGAYLQGKFIDRRGIKYDAPKKLDKGADGDELAALISVAMEAFNDLLFEEPCMKSGAKYINETGDEPTCVTLKIQDAVDVSNQPDKPGITELEAKLLSFVSTTAGKQSKIVSQLIVKLFKNVHVSYIIGGQFAIGDSSAFEKMVTSFCEVGSRRLTGFYAYRGLYAFCYTVGQNATPFGGNEIIPVVDDPLNHAVALLLQEQDALEKRLP